MSIQLPAIENFKPNGEPTSVAQRWERWLKSFEYFVIASGVTSENRKKALLLHLAGRETQDIYETLTPAGNSYQNTLDALNGHFQVKKNVTFERSKFLSAKMNSSESTEQFITRLRKLSINCEYTDLEDQIRDRVVVACHSNKLRKRLLSDQNLTLNKCIEIARTLESATQQSEEIQTTTDQQSSSEFTNQIHKRRAPRNHHHRPKDQNSYDNQYRSKPDRQSKSCSRCGASGHEGSECRRSKGKICSRCGKEGHFQSVCRTKIPSNQPSQSTGNHGENRHNHAGYQRQNKGSANNQNQSYRRTPHRTNQVTPEETPERDIVEPHPHQAFHTTSSQPDPHVYIFRINQNKLPLTKVQINDDKIDILIDSGSSLNLLDSNTYDRMCPKPKLVPTTIKIFGYNSEHSLPVLGTFQAEITTLWNKHQSSIFHVIKGSSGSLLGKETAEQLDLLRVGPPHDTTNTVTTNTKTPVSTQQIIDQHHETFKGTGLLKNFQLQLHIDPSVTPIQQPIRRVPYHTRQKVEQELERLQSLDIIEPVSGPTSWLNPFVPVPKSDGNIRLCLDMRQANQAIKRERHVIPKMEDIIQDLHGAKVFSKIDLREGYHQIKLHENSRDITTFATHKGLYRYKRLIFGVNSAFESFQKQIEQVLADCHGARNISDDILIWGRTIEEHDKHLQMVLDKFEAHGLKINPRKLL